MINSGLQLTNQHKNGIINDFDELTYDGKSNASNKNKV